MELNLTVFVQIVHFVIAYIILERFFFRPAFSSITDQDQAKKVIGEKLAHKKRMLAQSVLKGEESRAAYQRTLIESIPSLHEIRGTAQVAKVSSNITSTNCITTGFSSSGSKQNSILSCKQYLLDKILS